METIAIGSSGLNASRIGLGTWATGGWMWGGTDREAAGATVRAALDRGIRLIDTAPVYGFGAAEQIVGEALAASGLRHQVVLATKAGVSWAEGHPQRDSRPERLREELYASLRRLRTDYIDLYQLHWPDPLVPIEDAAGALLEMYREGLIRAMGVSNFSPAQMELFRSVAPLHCVQSPYNLFERQIETDVLPYAARRGIAVLAYGALCRGLLAGGIDTETVFPEGDLRRLDPKFADPANRQSYLRAVRELDVFAWHRFGRDVLSLALRWILDRGPSIALWGARQVSQLQPLERCFGWNLTEDDMAHIEGILKRHVARAINPDFMAPPPRKQTNTNIVSRAAASPV